MISYLFGKFHTPPTPFSHIFFPNIIKCKCNASHQLFNFFSIEKWEKHPNSEFIPILKEYLFLKSHWNINTGKICYLVRKNVLLLANSQTAKNTLILKFRCYKSSTVNIINKMFNKACISVFFRGVYSSANLKGFPPPSPWFEKIPHSDKSFFFISFVSTWKLPNPNFQLEKIFNMLIGDSMKRGPQT